MSGQDDAAARLGFTVLAVFGLVFVILGGSSIAVQCGAVATARTEQVQ